MDRAMSIRRRAVADLAFAIESPCRSREGQVLIFAMAKVKT
jgi:hypothetical protein